MSLPVNLSISSSRLCSGLSPVLQETPRSFFKQDIFTSFLKIIRRRYPNERRLIVILDNFSPHKKKEDFKWCRSSGVWLIFTATNASWMNRTQAQFGSVSYFVLKSSYPKNHRELEQNVKEHLKWRNNNRHNSLLKILQKRNYLI